METKPRSDESEEMAIKVFYLVLAGCVMFMIAAILVGIFEVIPKN
jgi:hypothetical protein